MKNQWNNCKNGYCKAKCGSDAVCQGFCTIVCHYAKAHSQRLTRPGCKETPKVLTKISIPDLFVSIKENEPASFTKLQTMFNDQSIAPTPKEKLYFKCLSAAQFDHTGNGKQYKGKTDRQCIDWDYHGECYSNSAAKYPNLVAGKHTQTVLEHKEIYKRQAFCHSNKNCRNKATLIVIEMRESRGALVKGLHNDASSASPGLVKNVLTALQSASYKSNNVFNSFLTALKSA